ncbi:hypothetical protein PG989_002329 [Apiospora arundinis]
MVRQHTATPMTAYRLISSSTKASGQLSTEIAVSLGFSKPKYSASSFSSEGIGESNVSSAAGNSNGKGTNNNNNIHLFVFHRPLCGPSV